MATKPPSEWLRLLCPQWSNENQATVEGADVRFLQYKPYLQGQLTSQLLCRLSVSTRVEGVGQVIANGALVPNLSFDFWKILGIEDEFDRAHVIANVERFCSLYNIRGDEQLSSAPASDNIVGLVSGTTGSASPNITQDAAAAAAAAAIAGLGLTGFNPLLASAALGAISSTDRRPETKVLRDQEREAKSIRKATEKAAKAAEREEKRQRKLSIRKAREEYNTAQKDAALQRAAELVNSNRVPIEITRGAAAARTAATTNIAVVHPVLGAAYDILDNVPEAPSLQGPPKKIRSNVVISSAADLDRIVTLANSLWAKYNAIAKQHNQKVNWNVVAKELGIHVKVREKYSRMHARAKARGFDFVNWGHYRIKDYPQYFLDPLIGGTEIPPTFGLPHLYEEVKPAATEVPQHELLKAPAPALPLMHPNPSMGRMADGTPPGVSGDETLYNLGNNTSVV